MNLQDKEFYALNLDDKSVQLSIKNAKYKIAEIKLLQEKFKPDYDEKRTFYEQVKKEFMVVQEQWNSLEQDIKDQEVLVTAFSKFFHSTNPHKRLQKMLDKKDKPKGADRDMNVSWIDECIKVLTKNGAFMTWNELWANFAENKELVASAGKNKTKFMWQKSVAFKGIMKSIERKRIYSASKLGMHQEKIGLSEWLDDNNFPYPLYLKEFMYHNGNGVLAH